MGNFLYTSRANKEAKLAYDQYMAAVDAREEWESTWNLFEKGFDILTAVTGIPFNVGFEVVQTGADYIAGPGSSLWGDDSVQSDNRYANYEKMYNEGLEDWDKKYGVGWEDAGDLLVDLGTAFYYGGGADAMKAEGGEGWKELLKYENYFKNLSPKPSMPTISPVDQLETGMDDLLFEDLPGIDPIHFGDTGDINLDTVDNIMDMTSQLNTNTIPDIFNPTLPDGSQNPLYYEAWGPGGEQEGISPDWGRWQDIYEQYIYGK